MQGWRRPLKGRRLKNGAPVGISGSSHHLNGHDRPSPAWARLRTTPDGPVGDRLKRSPVYKLPQLAMMPITVFADLPVVGSG
jgi:hypothetical protein